MSTFEIFAFAKIVKSLQLHVTLILRSGRTLSPLQFQVVPGAGAPNDQSRGLNATRDSLMHDDVVEGEVVDFVDFRLREKSPKSPTSLLLHLQPSPRGSWCTEPLVYIAPAKGASE